MPVKSKTLAILRETDPLVWVYPVRDLEDALITSGVEGRVSHFEQVLKFPARAASRLGLIRNVRKSGENVFIVILMGPAEYRMFPNSILNETILCCFDCWPEYYDRWESIFRRHRTGLAFFTARQSADYFSKKVREMRSHWMPEAVNPKSYDRSIPLTDRSIEVLELGRRHEGYHGLIESRLKNNGRVHLYEKKKGELIFPTKNQLIKGLSEARISICFPGSMTNSERSGNVETVTHRYFESMASGCVLVGKCPQELLDLFGFNPVIEADFGDPVEQIENILAKPEEYQEKVDINYNRLLEVGTWQIRADFMLEEITKYLLDEGHGRGSAVC